jgi:transposase InsO family protein
MVWLVKQGIRCCFSGVRHPQTQGEVERFHGSLGAGAQQGVRRTVANAKLAG